MARVFLAASSEALTIAEAPVTGPPFTVSFWFRPTTVGVLQTMFWFGDASVTNHYFQVGLDSTNHLFVQAQVGVSTSTTPTTQTVTVNTWHHAMVTFASNTSRIVSLDDQTEAENTSDLVPLSRNSMAWGRSNDSTPSQYYDGYLFWGSIYSEAILGEQRTPLANGACPLHHRREHLERFYPFVGEDDKDLIAGKILSVVGTPTFTDSAPSGLLAPAAYALPAKGYWAKGSIESGISLKT